MKTLLLVIGGGVALAWSAAAVAKPGDAAWARCVWESDPQAAAAWLAGPLPAWMTAVEARESLLGYRLASLCGDEAADPKKPNRQPAWKTMAAALRKAKPKGPLPAAVSGPPSTLLCEWRTDGESGSYVYLYQIVRRGQLGESVAFEQYMARANGMAVKLPAGLRGTPTGSSTKTCRRIGSGGELS